MDKQFIKKYKKVFSFLNANQIYYQYVIVLNKLKRLFKPKASHKFLFILSPPFCGSTLLNQIISSSKNVSVNNELGTREGQTLPKVSKLIFNNSKKWDDSYAVNWNFVKTEWEKYWNLSRPILLEKSPPNLVRAKDISNYFKPSYFIVFYRNPYAHCESLMRRKNNNPTKAAKFALKCLEFQKKNIEELNNTIGISYEDLTSNISDTAQGLIKFLPELLGINYNQEFSAHNFRNEKMKITNLNSENISRLTKDQINEINIIFKHKKSILDYFNYEIIK